MLARPRDRVDQDGSDTVAFGLHHALDMIQAGGPNIIEIFADDAHILGSDELGDMILALKPFVLTTLPVNGLEGYAAGQAAMARRRPDQAGKRLMHAIRVTRMTRIYRETGRLFLDCRSQRGRYLAVRQGDLNLGWRWYARERERLDDARTILPDHDPDALAEAVRPILRMALNRALFDRPAQSGRTGRHHRPRIREFRVSPCDGEMPAGRRGDGRSDASPPRTEHARPAETRYGRERPARPDTPISDTGHHACAPDRTVAPPHAPPECSQSHSSPFNAPITASCRLARRSRTLRMRESTVPDSQIRWTRTGWDWPDRCRRAFA